MSEVAHACDDCGGPCDCGFDEADCGRCSDCYQIRQDALDSSDYDADDEEADDEGYGHGVRGIS